MIVNIYCYSFTKIDLSLQEERGVLITKTNTPIKKNMNSGIDKEFNINNYVTMLLDLL